MTAPVGKARKTPCFAPSGKSARYTGHGACKIVVLARVDFSMVRLFSELGQNPTSVQVGNKTDVHHDWHGFSVGKYRNNLETLGRQRPPQCLNTSEKRHFWQKKRFFRLGTIKSRQSHPSKQRSEGRRRHKQLRTHGANAIFTGDTPENIGLLYKLIGGFDGEAGKQIRAVFLESLLENSRPKGATLEQDVLQQRTAETRQNLAKAQAHTQRINAEDYAGPRALWHLARPARFLPKGDDDAD